MQATIAELWTYPIKGCAGVRLASAQALPTGLQHDRCMVVVHAETGRFITQRSHPQMALIHTQIMGNALTLHAHSPLQTDLVLNLDAVGLSKTVTVWRDTLPAIDMGDDAAAWFSQALGNAVRLVRFDPAQTRAVKTAPSERYLFADGYPYLVLSKASVRALNERLLEKGESPVGIERFRANVVLDDIDAHTEDYAATFTHASGAALTMASPCTRCQVPTIDQSTGQAHPRQEPTMTLNAYRYDRSEDGVTFGMNALISQACTLQQGDVLSVKLSF